MLKELFKYKQFDGKRNYKYFISFTQEYWPGQKEDTVLGRFEVITDEEQWAIDEIRVGTFKFGEFHRFNEKWGFKHYNIIGYWLFKLYVRLRFRK